MTELRRRLARRLHFLADRLDHEGAFRRAGLSFTLEAGGRGYVLHEDGRGCPVWYHGLDDYERAHTEALNPPARIDWVTMTAHPPGTNLRQPVLDCCGGTGFADYAAVPCPNPHHPPCGAPLVGFNATLHCTYPEGHPVFTGPDGLVRGHGVLPSSASRREQP